MVTGRTKGMTFRGKGNVVLVAAQLDDADGNPTEEYVLLRADENGRLRTIDAGAVATFLGLTDTPASYLGQGLLNVRVNAAEDALEFVAAGAGVDISCLVFNSVNTSIPNNILVVLSQDGETYDTDGMHDLVTNNSRITIQTAGKYLVWATALWTANATGRRQVTIFKNGVSDQEQADQRAGVSPGGVWQHVIKVMDLVVGDFVEEAVFQSSGGALNVIQNNTDRASVFGAVKILG